MSGTVRRLSLVRVELKLSTYWLAPTNVVVVSGLSSLYGSPKSMDVVGTRACESRSART